MCIRDRFSAATVPQSAQASTLQTTPKAVLPSNPDQVEIVARSGRHTAAGVELDRIQPVDGQRQGSAQAPVLLQVVVPDTVQSCPATGKVRGVQGAPNSSREGVNRVSLK